MSTTVDSIPTTPATHFWGKTLEENPQLEHVVNAVSSGNLLASANRGKLSIVVDQFSALSLTAPWIVGAANMKGSSLPPLPGNGTFDVAFTPINCVLTIKDHSGFTIHIWHGAGTESGLDGSYSGSWVKLGN